MRGSLSRRYLKPELYLVQNDRVSSSENSPRNRRTKSNFLSSATKGDFAWGVVSAIATGVAVTGACNDHSSLPPRHRDSLAATSKTIPAPPTPTGANVHGERHVRSMRRKDVGGMRTRVYKTYSIRLVCGALGHFLFVFFFISCYLSFDRKLTE